MRNLTVPSPARIPTVLVLCLGLLAAGTASAAPDLPYVETTMIPAPAVMYDQPPSPVSPAVNVEGVIEVQDYLEGQCTWWAAKRLNELTGSLDFYFGGGPKTGIRRDAYRWIELGAKEGLTHGNVPTRYAAVVFRRAPFTGRPGHVAFVEEVYGDDTFKISQYNYPNRNSYSEEVIDAYGVEFLYAKGYEPTQEDIDRHARSASTRLDAYFRSIGSPLEGHGAVILLAAERYGISKTAFWIGKMRGESQYCKDFARPFEKEYYNCGGIKSYEILVNGADANGSQLRKFPSYAEYFDASAKLWSEAYDHLSEQAICGKWVIGHGICANNRGWLITARQEQSKLQLLL